MGFALEQRLVVTKAILELINPSGDSNLIKHKPQGKSKFEDISLTFFESDAQGLLSHPNRPLYIPASGMLSYNVKWWTLGPP